MPGYSNTPFRIITILLCTIKFMVSNNRNELIYPIIANHDILNFIRYIYVILKKMYTHILWVCWYKYILHYSLF